MDADYIDSAGDKHDNLVSVVSSGIRAVRYKTALILFFVYLILSSDIFVNRVLTSFDGAVNGRQATCWGVIVQGIILCIAYICIDTLAGYGVI